MFEGFGSSSRRNNCQVLLSSTSQWKLDQTWKETAGNVPDSGPGAERGLHPSIAPYRQRAKDGGVTCQRCCTELRGARILLRVESRSRAAFGGCARVDDGAPSHKVVQRGGHPYPRWHCGLLATHRTPLHHISVWSRVCRHLFSRLLVFLLGSASKFTCAPALLLVPSVHGWYGAR